MDDEFVSLEMHSQHIICKLELIHIFLFHVRGHIILNDLALIPTVKYRINSLTTIVPYIWRVDV